MTLSFIIYIMYLIPEIQHIDNLGYYIYDLKTNVWTSSDILNEIFGMHNNYVKDLEGWLNIIHSQHRDDMSSFL